MALVFVSVGLCLDARAEPGTGESTLAFLSAIAYFILIIPPAILSKTPKELYDIPLIDLPFLRVFLFSVDMLSSNT